MIADFTKRAFRVTGTVDIEMADGRVWLSSYPPAVWRWLEQKPRDWRSLVVWDSDFDQCYGWDRFDPAKIKAALDAAYHENS